MDIIKVKLSKLQIGIFASGDTFGGGTSVIFSFFYLIFLTDVVGLKPAAAGTIFLICRIWDAISDPLMGHITDNTRTRYGRRRPYFLAGFFGVIAAMFLMWNSVNTDNQLLLFTYVLFANLFYTTINTMVNVPYAAMSAEISENTKERNIANGARMVVSQVASLICALVPLEIVRIFASEATGYRVMGIVFGIFFAIPFLLIFFFNKEAVQVDTKKQKLKLSDLVKPFKIKSFRYFTILYLFSFMTMSIVSSIFAYYMKYYLKRPGELTFVLGAMLIAQTIVIPFVVKLAERIGKPKSYGVFAGVWVLGVIILAFINPSNAGWLTYVAASVLGIGIGACITLVYLIYPDVTDAGEFKTGERKAGSYSGVISFMRKFSGAIASYIVTLTLQFSGYINPIKTEVDGVIMNVEQQQPESLITALKVQCPLRNMCLNAIL